CLLNHSNWKEQQQNDPRRPSGHRTVLARGGIRAGPTLPAKPKHKQGQKRHGPPVVVLRIQRPFDLEVKKEPDPKSRDRNPWSENLYQRQPRHAAKVSAGAAQRKSTNRGS